MTSEYAAQVALFLPSQYYPQHELPKNESQNEAFPPNVNYTERTKKKLPQQVFIDFFAKRGISRDFHLTFMQHST